MSKHKYCKMLQDQSSATKIDDSNLKDDRFLSKCKALLFLLRDLARFKGAERCTCASTHERKRLTRTASSAHVSARHRPLALLRRGNVFRPDKYSCPLIVKRQCE